MSLDRRLREQLERDAERIAPDVERNLGIVEARARRGRGVGSGTLLLATAVVIAAIVIRLGAAASDVGGPSPSVPHPTASTTASSRPSFDAIAGTYTVTLDGGNPAVAQYKLGGTWTMRLAATGEIFLSPPSSFGSGTSSLSGLAFTLTGDRFRNNVFYNDYCSSVGTYTWSRQDKQLRLAPDGDDCAIRQTLLSMTPWQEAP